FRCASRPAKLSSIIGHWRCATMRYCLRAFSIGVLLLAQQTPDPAASYRQRIDDYRSGTEVSDGDLARPAIQGTPAPEWTPEDLDAAAMLQTGVGLRLVKSGPRRDSAGYLDAAAGLLTAAVAADPARVEYARRWRDTVTGLLEAYGAQDLARHLDARGHELWPQSK